MPGPPTPTPVRIGREEKLIRSQSAAGEGPVANSRPGPAMPWFDAAMGLFNRDSNDPVRFRMREEILSIGGDAWIENEDGDHVYRVNGKAMRLADTIALEDTDGNELAWLKEPLLKVRDSMDITIGDREATVKKKMMSIRDTFFLEVKDGPQYKAKGDLVDHEYEIESDGKEVAKVSKKWFRMRETYGIEIEPDQDLLLLLCFAICIDSMNRG